MEEHTSNSEALFNGLLELARGDDKRLQELHRRLLDPAVLAVLDSDDDYEAEMPEDLYIAGVLMVLMQRNDQPAQRLLSKLTVAPDWPAQDARIELLIQALATVRPPTPEALSFWDQYSQPDDGFANITVDACIVNGSQEAIDLVGRKLANPEHSAEERAGWLYSSVVPHRNDETLLAMLAASLQKPLEPEVKSAIVDVIFDHRPEEWYSIHTQVFPPPRSELSGDGAGIVAQLAERLLATDQLTDRQREAVEETREELGEIAAGPR